MSVFPDGSKIKTEVPVRNRRSRCRESARNNSEAQRWHSQLPPTEIELLGTTFEDSISFSKVKNCQLLCGKVKEIPVLCVTPFFVEQLSTKGRHNLIHLCEKLCPTCSTSVYIPTILTLQQQAPHHQPKQQKKLCTQSPPPLIVCKFKNFSIVKSFCEISFLLFDKNFVKAKHH